MYSGRQEAKLAKIAKEKEAQDTELREQLQERMKAQRVESKPETKEVKYKKPGLE